MPTVAEMADRLAMPEREARVWLARFSLAPEISPDGAELHPPEHEAALAIVREVLACPYASPALAVHAVEAALAPDYPDEHWPRELDRLKARLLALVDECRDRRAEAKSTASPVGDPAPADSWIARIKRWISRG